MSPQELITHFGTQAAAAKALGCAQSTVAEWCSDGAIPEGRQYQIELATAGALVADKPALREPMAAPTKGYDHRDYSKPWAVEPVCDRCNTLRGPAKAAKAKEKDAAQ